MGLVAKTLLAGCLALALAASTAYAQIDDPSPGSPAGTLYELPVGGARKDAAPRPGGQGSSSAALSSFRSENRFGTSAVVPGAPVVPDGKQGGGPPASAETSGIDPSATADTGDTSPFRGYLLLALIVAVGLLLGLAASRRRPPAS